MDAGFLPRLTLSPKNGTFLPRNQKGGNLRKMNDFTQPNSISPFPRRERLKQSLSMAKANLIIFNTVEFSCAGTCRYLSSTPLRVRFIVPPTPPISVTSNRSKNRVNSTLFSFLDKRQEFSCPYISLPLSRADAISQGKTA